MSSQFSHQEQEQNSPVLSLPLQGTVYSAGSSSNPIMDKGLESIQAVNEVIVVDGEQDDKEDTSYSKRKRKKTSDVWQKHITLQASGPDSNSESVNAIPNVQTWKYDQAKIREIVSHMIMVHELPFSFVEYDIFNILMENANPFYQRITQQTIKTDCVISYEHEKKRLKNVLKDINRVSITADLWKSGQKVQYMVITCHFVDNWKLHKRVLNFVFVPPPHSGVVVHEALYKCFEEWGIEKKVATITVDNTFDNDTSVEMLKDSLNFQKKLLCNGALFHVRCCAHILNLLVQDGLSEVQHVIENIRESVKYISASSTRLALFSEIAKQLHLHAKRLILDCCTSWNATYNMLVCALEFRKVFPRYQERDPYYMDLPTEEDWNRVEDICSFFANFNEVTNIISGSEYPTSNLFLPELNIIMEVINQKSVYGNEYMKAMATRMKTKFGKYWDHCYLLLSVAAVLDPRNKMKLIEFSFQFIYSDDAIDGHIFEVRDCLYTIYKEYLDAYTTANVDKMVEGDSQVINLSSSSGVGNTASTSTSVNTILSGRRRFDQYIRSVDTNENVRSELDVYLQEGVYKCDENASGNFDALEWWKANHLKFHILSKMASDILAIPITTVASEATFSAGGRVIDTYRSSLGVETVQALICGEDWFRNFYGIKRKAKVMEDVKEILLP